MPLVAATAAVMVLALALLALELWRSREAALDDGERRAEGLAHVLAEQTLRTLLAVDLTLEGLAEMLKVSPPVREHDPMIEATMRARLPSLPYVRALYVIGPDGRITQDTDRNTPDVSLADRLYFRIHRDDPGAGLHVGTPLVSRSVGTWFLSVSRRIDDSAGRFAGVAAAAVEIRYLTRFYRGIDVGPKGVLALFLTDGTLVARTPDDEGVGRSFAEVDPPFGRGGGQATATLRGASPLDGEARVVSFRPVEGLPLVVMVGLSEAALLAEWRTQAVVLGGAAGALVLFAAATAALLVERRRKQALAEARRIRAERLEALGLLTGGVAHDFGNLLTVIGVSLGMIRRAPSHADCPKLTDTAERAVQRGRQLVGQLLGFARRRDPNPETVSVDTLIGEFEGLLRHALGPGRVLETHLAHTLPAIRIDPGEFQTALLNLVVNARDATAAGGRVVVSTDRAQIGGGHAVPPGAYVRVRVRDTGSGMPPGVLERALEPFFTTKPEGRGTGLGLSQVYGFVQQSGGHVTLDSRQGEGTVVSLYFPEPQASASVKTPGAAA